MSGTSITPVEAQALSVQGAPLQSMAAITEFGGIEKRKALLARYGTQERERQLRNYYRHPQNTLVQGAFAGIVNKLISAPHEVSAPDDADSKNAQAMLQQAHFGKGFDYLISVTVLNFLRHDRGAFWELIGYGDPSEPLIGSPVAVAALDPLRVRPTNDREYPFLYWSTRGSIHKMHRTRIHQIVDIPDGDDDYPDVGMCALSRGIAIAEREINMARYISARLDDKPKPGVAIAQNLQKDVVEGAFRRLREERLSDEMADWGETVWLYGVDPRAAVDVAFKAFSESPEKFDFTAYVPLDVKMLALALGVDVQEIWELSGGGIGTGTQSQIVAAKARGKTVGRLFSGITRGLNFRVLPPECEFAYKYRDPQEDAERAAAASTYISIAAQVATLFGKRMAAQLLANQSEVFRDILLDDQGRVRLPDDDIEPVQPDTSSFDDTAVESSQPGNSAAQGDVNQEKAWADTASVAAYQFVRLINAARDDQMARKTLTTRLRKWLKDNGTLAYLDGMEEGGIASPELDTDDRATILAWLSGQSTFTTHFSKEVFTKGLSELQVAQRAGAWVENSLGEIRLKGLMSVKRNALFKWVMDPTAEHCGSCVKLNGHVHRLKDWMRYNIRPKSPALICWGGCKCTFAETKGEKATGKLSKVPLRTKAIDYVEFIALWEAEQKGHHG